jgi:hypothetical protein
VSDYGGSLVDVKQYLDHRELTRRSLLSLRILEGFLLESHSSSASIIIVVN